MPDFVYFVIDHVEAQDANGLLGLGASPRPKAVIGTGRDPGKRLAHWVGILVDQQSLLWRDIIVPTKVQ